MNTTVSIKLHLNIVNEMHFIYAIHKEEVRIFDRELDLYQPSAVSSPVVL